MKKILIVSGRSGAGKSTALQILEDSGYYCIDNLPLSLLPEIVDKLSQDNHLEMLALGVDARTPPDELNKISAVIESLDQYGDVDVVYLTARDDVLVSRFNLTRRPHPLARQYASLTASLEAEEAVLAPVLRDATLILDTSTLNVHGLKHLLLVKLGQSDKLVVVLQSFGFKYGLPLDADFVFDIRHLVNPHWHAELRQYNGLDAEIKAFLQQDSQVQMMYNDLLEFLQRWIPQFSAGHRQYLTVAIGCTGGKHRSVYFVDQLSQQLKQNYSIQVLHREMKHWS